MEKVATVKEHEYLSKWLQPEFRPGTVYVPPKDANIFGETKDPQNPRVAILCCPDCSSTDNIITRSQHLGFDSIVCAGPRCSSEYYFRQGIFEKRKPQ